MWDNSTDNRLVSTQNVDSDNIEDIEGFDSSGGSWGDYPIDDLLIRTEIRTIHDVVRGIDQSRYIMNPDFQRDFIWPEDKQSKLIESVLMRIPLPVFYTAEDMLGRVIVVDGLQRLTAFYRFVKNNLRLKLPDRIELNGCNFYDLQPKFKNRIEDCNLIFYTIDLKVPERARLDIFERVNGGVPLSRQQMRNCLFMGQATTFLKEESSSELFLTATGKSLNTRTMRDREFVNRFCAFHLFGPDEYRGDMDDYLARSLQYMNSMQHNDLQLVSDHLKRGLENNIILFGRHAFRKHKPDQDSRSVLNASLWDVMSTILSRYHDENIIVNKEKIRSVFYDLLENDDFVRSITLASNDTKHVKLRFQMANRELEEILGEHTD